MQDSQPDKSGIEIRYIRCDIDAIDTIANQAYFRPWSIFPLFNVLQLVSWHTDVVQLRFWSSWRCIKVIMYLFSMLAIPEAIRKVNDSESMTVTQYTWTSPEDSLEILLTHRLPTERWSKIPKFQQTLLWNCVMNLRRFHIILYDSHRFIIIQSSFHVIPEVGAWSPLGEAM